MARTAIAAAILLIASCRFDHLEHDLERIHAVARVRGTVRAADHDGTPILVVALRVPERDHPYELVESAYFNAPSSYEFPLQGPGRYLVMAFEDRNRNQELDPGERSGSTGVLDVVPSEELAGRDIELRSSAERWPAIVDLRQVVVGVAAELDDDRFSSDAGFRGVWQPLEMIHRYRPGLYLLEAYSPDKTPVLFVHGMSGYGQEFRELIGSLDRRRFQPWLMTYPSGLALDQNAAFLSDALNEIHIAHPAPRLCIVAHSMGGVVARRALSLLAAAHPQPFVRGFVTIASPLGGMASAQAGVDMAPAVVPSWRDLVPEGDFMQALYEGPLSPAIEYRLLAAIEPTGSDDGVVPIQSQLRPEAQREAAYVRVFFATHTGALRDAEVMREVRVALDRCRGDSPPR